MGDIPRKIIYFKKVEQPTRKILTFFMGNFGHDVFAYSQDDDTTDIDDSEEKPYEEDDDDAEDGLEGDDDKNY